MIIHGVKVIFKNMNSMSCVLIPACSDVLMDERNCKLDERNCKFNKNIWLESRGIQSMMLLAYIQFYWQWHENIYVVCNHTTDASIVYLYLNWRLCGLAVFHFSFVLLFYCWICLFPLFASYPFISLLDIKCLAWQDMSIKHMDYLQSINACCCCCLHCLMHFEEGSMLEQNTYPSYRLLWSRPEVSLKIFKASCF